MKKYYLLVMLNLSLFIGVPLVKATIVDISQIGTVTVQPIYDGKTVAGGNLNVYQVATVIYKDGPKAYQIQPAFSTVNLVLEDDTLEQKNAEYASQLLPLAASAPVFKEVETIADAGAVFDNMSQGLYLFVQTQAAPGYEAMKPFLLTLPKDGQLEVSAIEKMSPLVAKPTEPDTVIPDKGKQRDKELPFTGQIWWPIPVLLVLGIGLILLSFGGHRRHED